MSETIAADIDVSQVQELLNRMREMRVEKLKFHRMVARPLRRSILQHQEEQRGIDGLYRPLSPTYEERKLAAVGSAPILQWEGDLIDSIEAEGTAESATATFTDEKAAFHMGEGPFNQPNYRRDPLFIDEEFIAKVEDMAASFFGPDAEETE